MFANEIIIRPIITEKTMKGNPLKQYTFEVAKTVTKIDIRRAIEELFDVEVMKVTTSNVIGHLRRQRNSKGYTPSWKKAVVRLKLHSKVIEFFDTIN